MDTTTPTGDPIQTTGISKLKLFERVVTKWMVFVAVMLLLFSLNGWLSFSEDGIPHHFWDWVELLLLLFLSIAWILAVIAITIPATAVTISRRIVWLFVGGYVLFSLNSLVGIYQKTVHATHPTASPGAFKIFCVTWLVLSFLPALVLKIENRGLRASVLIIHIVVYFITSFVLAFFLLPLSLP